MRCYLLLFTLTLVGCTTLPNELYDDKQFDGILRDYFMCGTVHIPCTA